jgi:subfamily B ATP-binding cassette protein MsbA
VRLLREAVRPHWPTLVAALACMAVVAAMTGATAALMKPVVDKVFIAREGDALWLVAGAVVATFLIKSAASYGQDTLVALVGQKVIAEMQNRLFRHLLAQDVALFQSVSSGTLVSHFTYDVNVMRNAVSSSLVGLGRDSLSVVALVGVMFYQDWALSLVTLVVAPLTVLPVQRLTRRMRRVSQGIQNEMAQLTTMLTQTFQGIRVIKSFAMEQVEAERFASLVNRLFKLNFRGARVSAGVQPIIDAFGGVAVALVIVYGGSRVITGVTTAGAFFSFIAAVLTAYQPLRSLGKVAPNLQEGLAAAERIYAVLDRATTLREQPQARALPRAAGEIRFDRVSFSYGGEEAALRDLDLVAAAGKITALVGPSGAGKSTVFSLIPRFYDPQAGRITINGEDIGGVTIASLRDAVAIVSQDVVLFDDTIAGNIRYGRHGADDAAVRAAAQAAAADDFIKALPEGYDTLVGERGLRLSGGQRQRIAIARALLKDAPILLLDEATSALDSESERLIQTALARLVAGRTTLVIAHRLATIAGADAIHVMQEGRVVETGTHDALLKRPDGLYARLHALQFAELSNV